MQAFYQAVKRELEKVDFDALWPGFHAYPFALYDHAQAVLDGVSMIRPVEFWANTALRFQGQLVAIYQVPAEDERDAVSMASLLVHEMFHAFQMDCGETRFPDDLSLAAATQTPEALAWKAEEYRALVQDDLPRFRAVREIRRAMDPQAVQQELLTETVEGMAQYMELAALGQLSAEKRRAGLQSCAGALAEPERLLDARRCAYHSGTLLLTAAAEQGLAFSHSVGRETRPVYDLIAGQIPAGDPPARPPLAPWQALLQGQRERRQHQLQEFLHCPHRAVTGQYSVCGYDPMNLWREEDLLFSTSYLALRGEGQDPIELQGQALLYMVPGSAHRCRGYVVAEQPAP